MLTEKRLSIILNKMPPLESTRSARQKAFIFDDDPDDIYSRVYSVRQWDDGSWSGSKTCVTDIRNSRLLVLLPASFVQAIVIIIGAST